MKITIHPFEEADLDACIEIWNEVVEEGVAFPQTDCLGRDDGYSFFCFQTYTGVAVDEEENRIVGLYILHPNNVGRCGHICNASYAVKRELRGKRIGETLVRHCMRQGKEEGFRILQFNAVVATNETALKLYQKLGFQRLGTIPGGFLKKDGTYEDIIPHYIEL